MKPCFLAIIILCYWVNGVAQIADTVELKNVNITAKNSYGAAAIKTQKIDSLALTQYQSGSLGELLQNATPIFVKQYGSNGAQTVTFRGMAGAHTGVFLNGLNINPSSLGLTDLSVYPSFLFSSVGLKYGNAAFAEGNGALGGGIMLKSESNLITNKPNAEVLIGAGSFGKQQFGTAFAFRKKHLSSSTRFIWQQAQNDFEYINTFKKDHPSETQTHAFNTIAGVHQQFNYLLNNRNSFFANLLYTDLFRQIPKLMSTEQPSRATQNDKNIVAQLGWKNYGTTYQLKHILGYTGSDLHYINPSINTDASTINHKAQLRQDFKKNFNEKSSISTVLNYSYATAENPNLQQQNAQSEGSLLAMYNRKMGYVEWSASLKGGFNNSDGYVLPFLSLGMMPLGNKLWVIGANVAHNKKFASLNDLYWVPGGNPELQPEVATTAELNNQVNWVQQSSSFKADATFYFSQVANWILWKPSGQGYWMAQNVQEVLSYGAEVQGKYNKEWKKHEVLIHASYNWVNALNNSEDPTVKGKKLIYTPTHQANMALDYSFKQYGITYGQSFFGKRYTSSDNSSFLTAYTTGNIGVYAKVPFGIHRIDVRFDVNNLWDESYTVVAAQPMMGRNVMFTLKYNLNK